MELLNEINNEIVKYKKELTTINKKQKYLISIIKSKYLILKQLKYNNINVPTNFNKNKIIIECENFIFENKIVTTKQIIEFINNKFTTDDVRSFKGEMDSNKFMSYIGKYLKNNKHIKYIKDNKLNKWESL